MPKVKIGLARIVGSRFGWSRLAGAAGIMIAAAAAVALFELCHQIDFHEVIAALEAQPARRLLAAGGFVVAGYLALTCYDVFALRAIGCGCIPYRVAAFASFTSYTIGHNFGGTAFTSGLIRYRIYSAWGLDVFQIARIAFITGLTYCLGNAFVLGCGAWYAPQAASAIDHLPAAANRLIGIAGLAALGLYLLWLRPCRRVIGRSDWQIALPRPLPTLLQIAIGALDLVCVALALYAVLPAAPPIRALDAIVIFVTAMLIGVVSYVPGSLGVMEAAMLVSLPQFRREDLLASLVTFRLMYFVVPLLLAVALLGVRELRGILATARRHRNRTV